MHGPWLLAALILPLSAAAAAAADAAADAPRTVSVELPEQDQDFPDHPGVDAVANNCLACHSSAMILNQPALPKAAWEAEVAKMRKVYKAPVADEDLPAILDYLAALSAD